MFSALIFSILAKGSKVDVMMKMCCIDFSWLAEIIWIRDTAATWWGRVLLRKIAETNRLNRIASASILLERINT